MAKAGPPSVFRRRIPVYRGHFGPARGRAAALACRFRPAPGRGEAPREAGPPRRRQVPDPPGRATADGPARATTTAIRLAPKDAWGHDHLWWLDRMVRSNRPLLERMTLVWHDWFATSNDGVGSQKLMLQQNAPLPPPRRSARSSNLLLAVTKDPAMLLWLYGTDNSKDSPNENYGARADGALHPRRRAAATPSATSASRPGR